MNNIALITRKVKERGISDDKNIHNPIINFSKMNQTFYNSKKEGLITATYSKENNSRNS